MTTILSAPLTSGHLVLPTAPPRSGILLNVSPSSSAPNSPKRTTYMLSPCPSTLGASTGADRLRRQGHSSHSSASSSTSSTDDLVSSTSATSASGTATNPSHTSRKIRFAPLPEIGRDYDDNVDLQSPGFLTENDSAASSPRLGTLSLLSPPATTLVTPPTLPNVGQSNGRSCSTLGLSLDSSDPPDSGQATETNTFVGSECATDDTHTATNSKKKKGWARLLRLSKPAPLSSASRSADENPGQFNLWRASSRESIGSICSYRGPWNIGSLSDTNASTASLGGPLSRRKSAGVESSSTPVSPALSFRSLKPVISEVGTSSTPAVRAKGAHGHSHSATGPPVVRRGTRLLNGRVYGSRQANMNKNLFANARDEPEFVEWGHGGMGSVRASAGNSQWAALQSDKKLCVGHVAEGSPAADEDDGSGMGWVKRRREQRERERKEREAMENGEVNNEGATVARSEKTVEPVCLVDVKEEVERNLVEETKPEAVQLKEVPGAITPADASEEKEVRDSVPQEDDNDNKGEEERGHVYTAVTIPARPHHHHTHSHSSYHSFHSNHSAPQSPTLEASTGEATFIAQAAPGVGPSPLSAEVSDGSSTSVSSASSSCDDEEIASKDSEDKDDDEDDDELEDGEEAEEARKTAIGAGVEKISRLKD